LGAFRAQSSAQIESRRNIRVVPLKLTKPCSPDESIFSRADVATRTFQYLAMGNHIPPCGLADVSISDCLQD
jgi:hypothetical protein